MNDLIYFSKERLDEIKKLFPNSKIKDASDVICTDRISIEVDLEEKEYFQKILFNGFGTKSLGALMLDKKKVNKWIEEWKINHPEYFFKSEPTKEK